MDVKIDTSFEKVHEIFGIKVDDERIKAINDKAKRLWEEQLAENGEISTGDILKGVYPDCETVEEVAFITYLVAFNAGSNAARDPLGRLMMVLDNEDEQN